MLSKRCLTESQQTHRQNATLVTGKTDAAHISLLTLPEIRLFDDCAEDPGVGEDHDEEGHKVDGDEEEDGEGRDRGRVRAEGHALLQIRHLRSGLRVPHERLHGMGQMRHVRKVD